MSNALINLESMSSDDLWKRAQFFSQSDLIPASDRGKPANIVVKWQYGHEIGLSPMSALQGIAVINGKPSVWGDSLLGLARSHPDFKNIEETFDDDTMTAKCVVTRRGQTPVTQTFSKRDAEIAGIAGGNVHKKYPKRMLQMRARGFAIRDAFADKLAGLISAEEARDYPQDRQAEKVISGDFSSKADMLAAQIAPSNPIAEIEQQPANDPSQGIITPERKHELVKDAVKERQQAVEVKEFDADGVIEALDGPITAESTVEPCPEYKPGKVKSHPVMEEIKGRMGL
jgi:hypothetical protein